MESLEDLGTVLLCPALLLLLLLSKMRRLVCYIEMLLGRLVPHRERYRAIYFVPPHSTLHCDDRSAKAKTALPTTLFCVIFLAGSR
jgi:hypothetical protein